MKLFRMTPAAVAVCVGAGLFVACETMYTYVPASGATTTVAGQPGATYSIPADAPHGSLSVASFGFADVSPSNEPQQHLSALQVRMVLTNHDTVAWSLDTRQQRIQMDGRGESAPAFASADPGTAPPLVTVEPAATRVTDLFFVLPADMQTAEQLPAFDALWQVNAGEHVVSGRTPFQRLVVQPAPVYDWDYGYYDYWGPPYWYNPYPYYGGFYGRVVVPPYYHHHPGIYYRGIHGPYHPGYHGYPHGGSYHGAPHGGGGGHHR
jgi:hypothetical protein